MNYQKNALEILDHVGGASNVINLSHCATRLRFKLKDVNLIAKDKLEAMNAVLGIADNGSQFQIIIGNDVANFYRELSPLLNNNTNATKEKKSLGNRFVDTITSIFTPILPPLTASGMLKAVLALLISFKLIDNGSQVYKIINFMADSLFYFLPILLANSAAKKFKTNPYLAMMLGAILIHPSFIEMVKESVSTGEVIKFFMIPIYNANYTNSVIPIIISVWIMSYIERWSDKVSPNAIKFFTKPLLTILISGILALSLLAPVGFMISNIIAGFIKMIESYVPWLVPVILGSVFPLLVMTGSHYSIVPIGSYNRATFGYDTILNPSNLPSNIAQGAASLAVAIKTKNKDLKQLASSAGITALCGITEPALYGVNAKYKKGLIASLIGGGLGGLYAGIMQIRNYAGGSPGLLVLPGYIGDRGFYDLIHIIIAALIGFCTSFLITFFTYKDEQIEMKKEEKVAENIRKDISVKAIARAKMIDITKVNDTTFANEILGKGVAFDLTDNIIKAPISAKVVMLFKTNHAIGLKADNGLELLIHIGINTVNLDGKYFKPLVKEGDIVQSGDKLIEFDKKAILNEGYDLTTMLIVTNSKDYDDIICLKEGEVLEDDIVIKLR